MIKWFSENDVAANLLMLTILLVGIHTMLNRVPIEFMPAFELDTVTITTELSGGTASTIDSTITSRIEESISGIQGIKEINSRSGKGVSSVFAQIDTAYDKHELLEDIKLKVDALSTLPTDAEKPVISLTEVPIPVVGVAVYSDKLSYRELYTLANQVRNDLLQIPGFTKAGELFAVGPEIHIEVSPETLKEYQLTLVDITQAIRGNSADISAGSIETTGGQILVRTKGLAKTKSDFEQIVLLSRNGQLVRLGEIATIIDGFELFDIHTSFNGENALLFETKRTGNQSTIEVANIVKDYVKEAKSRLPEGVKIGLWQDAASVVNDRLQTLISSALLGGILVIALLTLFLRPAVALWVSIGIPVSFFGAFALMPWLGISLNMLSMLAFILVLGIVVDDAIVTGENIYRHIRNGMPPKQAAVFGTKEVAVPVTFGVVTTMIAFTPLLMVSGSSGDLAKQLPLIIIPVLFFSLIESKLILPSHLKHIRPRKSDQTNRLGRIQQRFAHGFEQAIIKHYSPFLKRCLDNISITLVSAVCIFIVSIVIVQTGWVKARFMPEFTGDAAVIRLAMPKMTGYETTDKHIDHIVTQANLLKERHRDPVTGKSAIEYVISVAGVNPGEVGNQIASNVGMVVVEISPADQRPADFNINVLINELRELVGAIPGAQQLSFSTDFADFGSPINISFFSDNRQQIESAASKVRQIMQEYPGIFDIQDNFSDTQDELQIFLKPKAHALGLSLSDVTSQVAQAMFGLEAQRIQRGTEELKVMVRYPEESRASLQDLNSLPIRSSMTANQTVPFSEVAGYHYGDSPNAIYRKDQQRNISITADFDTQGYDLKLLKPELDSRISAVLEDYPEVRFEQDGDAKTERETMQALGLGLVFVILMIYCLLAIPFKSFAQPLIVMSIIPLAFVGALLGHLIMGEAISMLSFFGMLGLTGIVVNDSLVLVDYINKQRLKGMSTYEAVATAGVIRFRPVILTSLTTFLGLAPLILSTSLHAQALIPMAISLGFGILFATLITLIVVPVNYLLAYRLKRKLINFFAKLKLEWSELTG
jgi:multidrug efflux pump subunit AcrB